MLQTGKNRQYWNNNFRLTTGLLAIWFAATFVVSWFARELQSVTVLGLAAALSTADGLMLTIANSLSHDVYFKMIDPNAPTSRRMFISKALLLVVAVCAAYITSLKPGDILILVGAAFSLGIFWKRANKMGAIIGMLGGLGVCVFYICITYPFFGINAPLWWDISPISAGVFGMPVGFAGVTLGSLLTAAPEKIFRI